MKSMLRFNPLAVAAILSVALILFLAISVSPARSDEKWEQSPLPTPESVGAMIVREPIAPAESAPGDLLVNGNMDQLGFYWRYPNHWIANGWFEWFSTSYDIPEYTDGHERGFAHTHPSSQRLQLWGSSYAGGLMQPVDVAPCLSYRFEAYGHSRPGSGPPPVPVNSHMKVGIEPYGWMSDRTIPKYDPGLEVWEFPSTVVWSPEATHDFVWSPYRVTAEAKAYAITVILFSNPEVNPSKGVWWNDTLWDTASLVIVPPENETLVSSGPLPAPDGQINDVTTSARFNAATLEWRTSTPAVSQVLYHYVGPAAESTLLPPPVEHTDHFEGKTEIGLDVSASHAIRLSGLSSGSIYDVALLSRFWTGDRCQTSAYVTRIETPDTIVPTGNLPPSGGYISDLHVIPQQRSAYIWWRSSVPAFSQVLYHQVPPKEPPGSTLYMHILYLPLVAKSSRPPVSHFEFKTPPSSAQDTVHWYHLTDLEPETTYEFAGVNAWTENGADKFAASPVGTFKTGVYAQTADVEWDEIPEAIRLALCDEWDTCPGNE